jgi:hypothetical protein
LESLRGEEMPLSDFLLDQNLVVGLKNGRKFKTG